MCKSGTAAGSCNEESAADILKARCLSRQTRCSRKKHELKTWRWCHERPILIALMLVWALFGSSVLEARVRAEQETTKKPTLQERILEVSPGTMIEVRLMNKHKLRGRLGEVTNEGFALQTAQGTKVETQKLAFTEVKSFKQVEGTTGKKIGRGVAYGLAGIGAFFVIMIAVCLSGGCGG